MMWSSYSEETREAPSAPAHESSSATAMGRIGSADRLYQMFTVVMNPGVTARDLVVTRDQSDLVIGLRGSADQIVLESLFTLILCPATLCPGSRKSN